MKRKWRDGRNMVVGNGGEGKRAAKNKGKKGKIAAQKKLD